MRTVFFSWNGMFYFTTMWIGWLFLMQYLQVLQSGAQKSKDCVSSNFVIHKRKSRINCDSYRPQTRVGQRGKYWVFYNYFKPTKVFECDQSITYTTHSDWTYLDNLVPLLERWQGPLSLALYSPGSDFQETVKRIQFLRECQNESPLIKQLVSFHLFFDQDHVPENGIVSNLDSLQVNCTKISFSSQPTFKKANNLIYPVNVARNVAREMATTHFVFPSDIELYPSPNFIPQFLEMIQRNDTILQTPNPKVFVLPIFEVEATITQLPNVKQDLVFLLQNKSAILFHKNLCPTCHRIPKMDEWVNATVKPGMHVFHVGKRYEPYQSWEPIYIGTKSDPVYDERLSWEGRSDKMTQGYLLCVLDYEFHILDNAFLVHRPGIKKRSKVGSIGSLVVQQNKFITQVILPELSKMFGERSGCVIH